MAQLNKKDCLERVQIFINAIDANLIEPAKNSPEITESVNDLILSAKLHLALAERCLKREISDASSY